MKLRDWYEKCLLSLKGKSKKMRKKIKTVSKDFELNFKGQWIRKNIVKSSKGSKHFTKFFVFLKIWTNLKNLTSQHFWIMKRIRWNFVYFFVFWLVKAGSNVQ